MTARSQEIEVERRLRVWVPVDGVSPHQPVYLVDGVIPSGSLLLLYGASSSGKTALAVDVGSAIALGRPWFQRQTRPGLVLHVAGEGAQGLRRRVLAAYKEHGKAPDRRYVVVDGSIDLTQPGCVDELIQIARKAEASSGMPIAILMVDTLTRCVDIDENDGRDMRLVIQACQRLIDALGATVLLIHHTGKDQQKGARGHSSLKAAVDTEIEVARRGERRIARVTKQRDSDDGDIFEFSLRSVRVEIDASPGAHVTSCVVEPRDASPKSAPPLRGRQRDVMEFLREKSALGETQWPTAEVCSAVRQHFDLHRNSARRVVIQLVELGRLVTSDGGQVIALTDEKGAP